MSRGMFSVLDTVKAQKGGVNIPVLFLTRLEQVIKEKEKPYTPSTYYTPSSLINIRDMYFKRTGAPVDKQDKSSDFIGILESGTDRHNRVQEALEYMKELDMEFEYIDPVVFKEEHNLDYLEFVSRDGMEVHFIDTRYDLSFKTDGIIKYDNEYFIFEMKTEVSFKFNYRTKQELTHETQACCYALSFGIDKTLFLYENRDLCQKKVFLYECTQEDIKRNVIDRINLCEWYIERGEVPPKLTDKDVDPNFNPDDYVGTSRMTPAEKILQYSNYKEWGSQYE